MKSAVGSPRLRELSFAVALTLGIIALQILIGGRRPLFAYSGYLIIAATGALAAMLWSRAREQVDLTCLGATVILFGYLVARNSVSECSYYARQDFYAVLAAAVVYGLSVSVLSSSRARFMAIALLLVTALPHVLIGLAQFTRGDNFMLIPWLQRADYGVRASGFYVCPNHLAGLLEVLGVFGLGLCLWSRWPVFAKLLIGYLTAVCFVGVALTGSRGGYISVIAGLFAFLLLSLLASRSGEGRAFVRNAALGAAVIGTVIALAGFLLFNSNYLRDRAGNIIDTKNMRLQLWASAIQQWELQPIVGTGGGSYRFYGRRFRAPDMQNDPIDVHNDYLHLLAEYGAVGFAAFLFFLAVHVRRGVKSFRHLCQEQRARGGRLLSDRLALNIGALCALSTYLVHSVVDFNLHIPANAMLMAFVVGMLANAGIRQKEPSTRLANLIPRFAVGVASVAILIQCGRFFPGEYWAEEARVALRDEKPDSAIAFAQKALSYESGNPEIYFYLGRAFLATGDSASNDAIQNADYTRAAEAFLEGEKLSPLDATFPLNAAFIFDLLRRYPEAEEMYGLARGRDPRGTAVADLYNFHLYRWRQNL